MLVPSLGGVSNLLSSMCLRSNSCVDAAFLVAIFSSHLKITKTATIQLYPDNWELFYV